VSAIRFLLANGESLASLGTNFDLNGASYHGHWRLCRFLLEHGAKVNEPLADTKETPLHAALCKTDRLVYDRVLEVLVPMGQTQIWRQRTGGDGWVHARLQNQGRDRSALHRAAAFGESETIQLLLDAGAQVDARDANGDTPLSWASWYLRPASILRQLCYNDFRIHPHYQGMRANLLGKPHSKP
jgi:ankyrin repeat protein